MDLADELSALDQTLEVDGLKEHQEEFAKFLGGIDLAVSATQVGVEDENLNRFASEYRKALWFYQRNIRPPRKPPSRQESVRGLNRIAKAAATLNKLLKEAYRDESDIWWFIDDAYMANETDAAFEHMPDEYEGLSLGECEMEKMIDGTAFLAEMISLAGDTLPNRGKGKPKVNSATEELVRRLAVTFTEHSGKPASSGNYWDAVSSSYEGKFTVFVEYTIGLFPQKYPLTNNAIGEIIRRALGSRKGQ